MEKDKILEYFEDLNLLTEGFKYYSNATKKERETLTFDDIIIKGCMSYHGVAEHSKIITDLKKQIGSKKINKSKKLIKTFATIFHRRELVTFFRETERLNYIDYNLMNQEQDWISVREDILKSDPTITQAELTVLNNVESVKILKEICNVLTHEQKDRFIYYAPKKPIYFNQTSIKSMDHLAGLLSKSALNELYDASYNSFKFKSFKLKKEFNFKITAEQMNTIVNSVINNLSKNIKMESNITLKPEQVNEKTREISLLPDNPNHFVKFIYDDNVVDYKYDKHQKTAIKNMFKEYFETLSRDALKQIKEEEILSIIDEYPNELILRFHMFTNMATIENSLTFTRLFNMSLSYFKAYEMLATYLILQSNLQGSGVNRKCLSINKMINLEKESIKELNMGEGTDVIAMSGIRQTAVFALQPEQIYKEVLLTQILNMLEYLDSRQTSNQELWKDLEDTYQVFDDISNKFKPAEWHKKGIKTIPGTIRNTIQHLRYVKDLEDVHVYDGENTIDYKFTISIEELEQIKECCIEFVTECVKNYSNIISI